MAVKDGTLVLGALEGDRAAFAELYDRRARLIRAICYDATHNVQTASDLTQEVFLRSYRNLGRLDNPDRFAVWLIGIARRVCREWRRKRRREQRAVAEFRVRQEAGRPSVEAPEQRLIALRDEIAFLLGSDSASDSSLKARERLALHAYYLQERSVEDACKVLNMSRSGFYRVLSSACERLRRTHGRQEVHP